MAGDQHSGGTSFVAIDIGKAFHAVLVEFPAGADSLVVDELGGANRQQKLQVGVTPTTRITYSERNPHATSTQDLFTENVISLTEVKKGDFVVVETTSDGKKLVAESVMVTLR